MASVLVSSGMGSTVTPRCFPLVSCDAAGWVRRPRRFCEAAALCPVPGAPSARRGSGGPDHRQLALPGTRIDLSLSHWVSDGLLVLFFFIVSVELQFELTRGELRSARTAAVPALAAAGGVLVPI